MSDTVNDGQPTDEQLVEDFHDITVKCALGLGSEPKYQAAKTALKERFSQLRKKNESNDLLEKARSRVSQYLQNRGDEPVEEDYVRLIEDLLALEITASSMGDGHCIVEIYDIIERLPSLPEVKKHPEWKLTTLLEIGRQRK